MLYKREIVSPGKTQISRKWLLLNYLIQSLNLLNLQGVILSKRIFPHVQGVPETTQKNLYNVFQYHNLRSLICHH